jgi:hypothetical protein
MDFIPGIRRFNDNEDWRFIVRKKVLGVFFGVIVLLAAAIRLPAHHGAAGFDVGKQVVMKGTVTEWLWANPHCYLKFDATDDKGEVAHWAAEVSNPVSMTKRGWTRHSFNAGDQVTVTVRPAKNGTSVGQLMKVDLPDGHTLIGFEGPIP